MSSGDRRRTRPRAFWHECQSRDQVGARLCHTKLNLSAQWRNVRTQPIRSTAVHAWEHRPKHFIQWVPEMNFGMQDCPDPQTRSGASPESKVGKERSPERASAALDVPPIQGSRKPSPQTQGSGRWRGLRPGLTSIALSGLPPLSPSSNSARKQRAYSMYVPRIKNLTRSTGQEPRSGDSDQPRAQAAPAAGALGSSGPSSSGAL